jgi:ubiquilin
MMPTMSPDQMERMLENPMFASQLTEFMNSPQAMQLMEPFFNQSPHLREMMRNPDVRRVLFSPESIRTQLQLSRAMGGGGFGGMGGGASFPAPGVTDNTTTNTSQAPPAAADSEIAPPSQEGQAGNPFAALFGPGGNGLTGGGNQDPNPVTNRALMERLLAGTRAPGASAATGSADSNESNAAVGNTPGEADHNNLLRMLSMMQPQGGAGPNFGDLFGGSGGPPAPADNRPPEERYADQLRQLNDMGFFDFDRNVQALRRSGGSVQGAIEHLLGGP